MTFTETAINDRSVGDRLKELRLERGESLKDVEKATRVAMKFLQAIEDGAFEKLPETLYARNFIRAVAAHYGIEPQPIIEAMLRERTAVAGAEEPRRMPSGLSRRLRATPFVIKAGLAAAVFASVVAYFGASVHGILKPPKLVILAPRDAQVFVGGPVILEGLTEPEVELTVNREVVPIEPDGSFHESLILPEGVSLLRVAAKKRHSREQEVYLKVIVEPADGEDGGLTVARR